MDSRILRYYYIALPRWPIIGADVPLKTIQKRLSFLYDKRGFFCDKLMFVVRPYMDPQQTSSDQAVDQGDDVELTCNATGRPAPTIEWSRLGGALLPIGQEKLQVYYVYLT